LLLVVQPPPTESVPEGAAASSPEAEPQR
jgi:hypothetical protein